MQPSWFNVDNLSTVLSVLSQRYTDFTQLYNSSVVPQNLFNYTFNSAVVSRLTRLGRLAQNALATQTVLALGGLLVMLGAGISNFGRAIEAASDRHLSSKERDDLIASASLSALANIALGLQMPLTQVLEKLVRRYTTARRAGEDF